LATNLSRSFDFLHLPVPKQFHENLDYYLPLKELKITKETKFFIGLLHYPPYDVVVNGNEKRIKLASQIVKDFGIATGSFFESSQFFKNVRMWTWKISFRIGTRVARTSCKSSKFLKNKFYCNN
jgi:hypothetical protein